MNTLTWIGSTGTYELIDEANGVDVWEPSTGLRTAPVELTLAPYLTADGSVLVRSRRGVRPVTLTLFVEDDTRVTDVLGPLERALQGPGTLRFDDGTVIRDLLNVVYESGFEGYERNLQSRVLSVTLLALDPWWYGESNVASLTFAAAVGFNAAIAFSGATGFSGSDANPVTVAGDASAFPTTTIVGPFTTLQVGVAGGQTFQLAAALAAGSTITVDTTPGNRGPRLNAGEIDWSLLTPTSRLWELPVGASVLNAAATGTTGASIVEVAWRERFLTP